MGWEEKLTLEGLTYYYNTGSKEVTWDKPDELLSAQEREENQGTWTWVPHAKDVWQPARKQDASSDGSVECILEGGKKITIPKNGKMPPTGLTGHREQYVPLWPLNRSALRHLEDDLVMTDGINEGMISHTLRERYGNNDLYTWVGAAHTVLVSVNPYKSLPLYSKDIMHMYDDPPPNKKLAPHPFAIAVDAYRSMLFTGVDQSILISGESGAGKTVATKQCLSLLAEIAGSERDTEEMILASNPLLEAFGNAQTIRNNNSSRFGKWIKVYFDPLERAIISGEIVNYLLEKSRLIYQQKNSVERNFHIFYQLTSDSGAMSKFGLDTPQNYRYTNQSGTYKAKDIDDAEDFQAVKDAMSQLQFSPEEQDWVLATAAGILKLGNVEFAPKKESGGVEGSQVKDSAVVGSVAKLLNLEEAELTKVLCYRSIVVNKQRSVIPYNPAAARTACDSFAMSVYSRLFDWLVGRVNRSLDGKRGKFIGILDIFGFEIFEENSFEQLNINFANEKLQQQFNRTTFKEEESLYEQEGVEYKKIEFIDNQAVLDMVEGKPSGILPLLDDECLVPEGSEIKYMNKVEEYHSGNERFMTEKHRKLNNTLAFEIDHYAGVVKYTCEDFMVKNLDTVYQDAIDMCSASTSEYMKELFPVLEGRKQVKTLSYQFRRQLNELMESLYKTESRYIRCVKPNDKQQSDNFETIRVIEQLRYSGVFEAVQIRKQGYPFRLTHRQFVCRYQCINPNHRYKARDDMGLVKELLNVSGQDFSGVQFGKTMILYRANEHRTLLLFRSLALETIVPRCQRIIRGGMARCLARALRNATDILDEALQIGNQISEMDKALAKSEKLLTPFKNLYGWVEPNNLAKAIRHRDLLQQWMDLEAVFERLVVIEKPTENDYKELKDAVSKGKASLDIPTTEKQMSLYEKGTHHVIYMEIYLQEQKITNNPKLNSLENYSGLRRPDEYVKSAKRQQTMCVWEKKKIPKSLTFIEEKDRNKLAVKNFENVLKWTTDKKNKDPEDFGRQVVMLGIDQENMRAEIYCQLIKQTSENTNEESIPRAWDLMAACLSCFTAPGSLEDFLLVHLKRHQSGVAFTSAYHNTKYGKGKKSLSGSISSVAAGVRETGRTRYSIYES